METLSEFSHDYWHYSCHWNIYLSLKRLLTTNSETPRVHWSKKSSQTTTATSAFEWPSWNTDIRIYKSKSKHSKPFLYYTTYISFINHHHLNNTVTMTSQFQIFLSLILCCLCLVTQCKKISPKSDNDNNNILDKSKPQCTEKTLRKIGLQMTKVIGFGQNGRPMASSMAKMKDYCK